NLSIEYRWPVGDADLIRLYAAELVRLKPDLIITSSVQNVSAFRELTHTIPIVFTGASDPVAAKLVESLARPGGNITGFTDNADLQYASNAKWLELLKELAPNLQRVGVVYSSLDPSWAGRMRALETASSTVKIRLSRVDALHGDLELEQGIEKFA